MWNMFKFNIICRHWHRSGVFVVNFEHILHILSLFAPFSSVSIVDFEYVFACWWYICNNTPISKKCPPFSSTLLIAPSPQPFQFSAFEIQVLRTSEIKCQGDCRIFLFPSATRRQKNCRRLSTNLCILCRQWLRHTSAFCRELWFCST